MKEVAILAGVSRQTHDNLWSAPPSMPPFPTRRVDVWRVRLDGPANAEPMTGVLSPDEVARAGRFHFEQDRIRFTRCRSVLRGLLSGYLAIPAAEIRFEYQANGKPQLAVEQNPRALQFNVSHAAGMALIAVGSEHRLGVDIETIRTNVDTSALAERFFSTRERAGLRALPDDLRVPGFFACWTRKEAFLKATGDGLSFPLVDFSVSTHPDLDPELDEIKGDTEAGRQWSLRDVSAIGGFRAAIALEGYQCHVETYAWN